METTDPAPATEPIVSEAADSLDSLVQQASLPSLATLFKRAKDRGVLQAGQEYVSTTNK
jgi:hypothetical protein